MAKRPPFGRAQRPRKTKKGWHHLAAGLLGWRLPAAWLAGCCCLAWLLADSLLLLPGSLPVGSSW
jgi:hypothetical protein